MPAAPGDPRQPVVPAPVIPDLSQTLQFILEEIRGVKSRLSSVEQGQSGTAAAPSSSPLEPMPQVPQEDQSHVPGLVEHSSPQHQEDQGALGAQHVEFGSPLVDKLPLSQIPPGWQVLQDGMSLGREPGSLVFADGATYGPQSVDVDALAYERPIWRFRTREGTSRPQKGIIPVLSAYDSIVNLLSDEPAALREWNETPFHPPGSTSNRAVVVNFDDESVLASFFSSIPTWFSNLSKGNKVSWDEATCPANIIPDSISSVDLRNFVTTFARKKFDVNEPGIVFNSSRVPKLSDTAVSDEHGARQNFLSCLNATALAEAIARQFNKDDPASAPHFAMLKMTLQPLWTSFMLFCQKKLELRKLALRHCFRESTLVVRLLSSNPLSPDLFDQEAMSWVTAQADRQARSILTVLGFRAPAPKRPAATQLQNTPKRQRQQQSPGYQRQQSTPGTPGRSPSYQQDHRQSYYTSPGRGNHYYSSPARPTYQGPPAGNTPSTPRGRGYRSPRGRAGRSPGPSFRGQRGQYAGKNF